VPVLLSTVGVNLRDCAPFGSMRKVDLDQVAVQKWEEHLKRGAKLQLEKQFEAAIEAYRAAEAIDETPAIVQYQLGRCHLLMGDHDQALERLLRARDLDSLRFRADSTINNTIRKAAQDADHVALVDAAMMFRDHSPDGIPGSALFYEHVHLTFAGNYLLAKTLLEGAEQQLRTKLGEPAGPIATQAQCEQALALTDFDRLSVIQLILGRLNTPPFIYQLDMETQVAQLTERADQLEAALKAGSIASGKAVYEQAIAQSPDDPWLHFRRGFFLLNGAGDAPGAQKAFNAAQDAGLQTAELHLGLGMAHYSQGELDKAIEIFREGLAIAPRQWRIWSQLGFTLNLRGKTEEAVEACSRAVDLAPDSPDVHTNLGLVLLAQEQFVRAAESLEKAVELGETAARRANLGRALAGQGKQEQAEAQYIKAVALDPANYRANRELGEVRLAARRFAEALLHLNRAHQARPDDVACANNLSWLLATAPGSQLRDGKRAVLIAQQVVKATQGNNPSTLDTLAAAYAEVGQFQQAVTTAQRAVALAGRSPMAGPIRARLALYQSGKAFRETP
jgi:tetratricopeptide (TPR) repeat protein